MKLEKPMGSREYIYGSIRGPVVANEQLEFLRPASAEDCWKLDVSRILLDLDEEREKTNCEKNQKAKVRPQNNLSTRGLVDRN
jgi:hypothetical protein